MKAVLIFAAPFFAFVLGWTACIAFIGSKSDEIVRCLNVAGVLP